MPDIDPAALSRPSVTLSTPILSTKSLPGATGASKFPKTSQIIPARIDLEPLYTALKVAIGAEHWIVYKESTTQFLIGRLNEAEYSERVEPILSDHNGEKEHLHNQLIAAIYGNVTREMPDQGPAHWVSANDKLLTTAGSKPVSGDAAERRLKGDVMQLPAKDRRRIKDLVHNDYDPHETISSMFSDVTRRASATGDVPASAGIIQTKNFDLEIKKRYTGYLGVETGEFPDVNAITGRMLPFCYEAGLANGHAQEAPQLVSLATETFIKEVLTQIFSRTRSNGPGDSASAGFGIGTSWIQTQKYRKQLSREEEAAQKGEVSRDKSGLLPVEAKAASERGPLGMADLRLALEISDPGLSQFPIVTTQVLYDYREGELENWYDYSWVHGEQPLPGWKDPSNLMNGGEVQELPNGFPEAMDVDGGEAYWDGADDHDMDAIDNVLDSCLVVGS